MRKCVCEKPYIRARYAHACQSLPASGDCVRRGCERLLSPTGAAGHHPPGGISASALFLWITACGGATIHNPGRRVRGKRWTLPPARRRGRLRPTPRVRQGPARRMHADLLPPAWALCLAAFERELTPQQFATWIRPLSCADEGGTLKLRAPNRFVLQWVKRALRQPDRDAGARGHGRPGRHRIRGRGRRGSPHHPRREAAPPARPAPPHRRPLWIPRPRPPARCHSPAGPANRRPPRKPDATSLNPASPSRLSWPARPTSSPAPPGCRSPTIPPRTTRCSSTAASASARRT